MRDCVMINHKIDSIAIFSMINTCKTQGTLLLSADLFTFILTIIRKKRNIEVFWNSQITINSRFQIAVLVTKFNGFNENVNQFGLVVSQIKKTNVLKS